MGLLRSKPRLLEMLVRAGVVEKSRARTLEREARRSQTPLCAALVAEGIIDEQELFEFLAERLEVAVVGAESLGLDALLLAKMPAERMRHGDFLPLKQVGRTVSLAMADPSDSGLLSLLERETGLKPRPMLAPLHGLRDIHRQAQALQAPDVDRAARLDAQFKAFFARLPDYRFERTIGEGGFGLVCRCRQLSLDRRVAIKVLNPDWNPVPQVTERFRREGQIIARLDHPNIINVYEQGELDGIRYIAMEYFQGQTLTGFLEGRELGRKLSILQQVAAALAYAHDNGVIHRDIKPANILVNDLGEVKLLDFGVAQFDAGGAGLTTPQLILGTPKYMAPELGMGADRASVRSDIFAFGVMAYEILTGCECETGAPRNPSRIDERIPGPLGLALVNCLKFDARQRPPDFEHLGGLFRDAMDQLVFGETTTGGERRLDETHSRGQRIAALQQLYEFKSVLRQDERSRTTLAHSRKLERDVVIRILENPRNIDRLRRIAELKELHIGEVLAVGKHDATVLVVEEYLPGGPISARIGRETSPRQVVTWLEGVVRALNHARKHDLAHGNLHPDNVLLDEHGTAKLVGFCIFVEPCLGWPNYRHPRPAASNAEHDRHGLGALTFEMLTGDPFEANRSLGEQFSRVAGDNFIHPLLRYFLARLWEARDNAPPYAGYPEMLLDLERIRNRLAGQRDWTGTSEAGAAAGMPAEEAPTLSIGPQAENF